ncbi:MAG: hypothetical protein JXD22_16325 [Sedimentisphaerales bacterium]|nr:hypothetical protein [Sedimentisphaerales bacterium]
MRIFKRIIFAVMILVVNGWGMVPITVHYKPSGTLRQKVSGYPRVSLKVNDVREKKVFYKNVLGEGVGDVV